MKILIFNILFLILLTNNYKIFAQVEYKRTGNCSFYGKTLVGARTSNGERITLHGKTAAHRTLPFGTLVKVTNLENGKSTIVRITDRGPFAKKRIIDITYPAAQEIGMLNDGVVKVKIEVVGYDPRTAEEVHAHEEDSIKQETELRDHILHDSTIIYSFEQACKKIKKAKGYGIQIGIFRDKENAEVMYAKVSQVLNKKIIVETPTLEGEQLYRILIGEYSHKQQAKEDVEILKKAGFETYLKKHND